MRLFTAIDLTEQARAAIVEEQHALAASLGADSRALKLVDPEHLHLTLVFLGDVPDVRAARLVEAMSADVPQAPFRIVFGGFGVFPVRGAPRVLWLGLVEGAEEVVELHRRVADRLTAAGAEVDAKPIHPHLTLARWREKRRAPRPLQASTPRVVAEVDVGAVALVQSRLSSAGPSYTRLAHARLVCP
jgi:2'-5' RNA ligase